MRIRYLVLVLGLLGLGSLTPLSAYGQVYDYSEMMGNLYRNLNKLEDIQTRCRAGDMEACEALEQAEGNIEEQGRAIDSYSLGERARNHDQNVRTGIRRQEMTREHQKSVLDGIKNWRQNND